MRPTPELLREALDYDPLTGALTWKTRPLSHFADARSSKAWNKLHAGQRVGTPDRKGYLRINMRGTPYLAHQLIWALVHEEYTSQVDHRNCNPADNRLDNLRACTGCGNQHNRGKPKTNVSGYKGVSRHKATGRWRAAIFVNSKQVYLGLFNTAEAAHAAYCEAADKLHGEFANHGACA